MTILPSRTRIRLKPPKRHERRSSSIRACLIAAVFIARVAFVAAAQSPRVPRTKAAPKREPIHISYLGNAGWEISDGRTIVLVDPFLSQFQLMDTAEGPPRLRSADSTTFPSPDSAGIDRRISRANFIVVTHGHFDHAFDASGQCAFRFRA